MVDLTQGSPEDDMLVTRAEPAGKRARLLPLPFSAPQAPPPLAKPDAKCAICLEPMVQMACGPCGCAALPPGPAQCQGWRARRAAGGRALARGDGCRRAQARVLRRLPEGLCQGEQALPDVPQGAAAAADPQDIPGLRGWGN